MTFPNRSGQVSLLGKYFPLLAFDQKLIQSLETMLSNDFEAVVIVKAFGS